MAFKQLKATGTGAKKYTISVPVFRIPTDEDFEDFAKDPLRESVSKAETPRTLAAKKFYASLRYPDGEVDVKYKR